ncbi:MAG TPA: hypothetical protein VNG90_02500, partial [Candidatus Acidoferrum sp.]|nr:hypothetical protein [Candidatus Acidoferrum sp.]
MPADLPIQSHLTILRTVHVGSFVSAVQKISYLNPQILKVLPDKYLDGPRYVAPCALARFERTGWQAVNVADKNAPRISLTLGEVLQQVSELTLDGQPCRPMLPRELAWLFAAMPHLQLQLQIVGLGYLLYSADEDRYRALVLGGGETTALDPPDPVHSLFYN